MNIEIVDAKGEKKAYALKQEITVDDFIRLDALKENLSLGNYAKFIQMRTKTSEINLDIIDGLAYLIVLFDESVRKELKLPESITDLMKLPMNEAKVLRQIAKQVTPIMADLLKDFES
jgi:hypothetical protein